ncbi:MAG: hypothetical protein RLZZ244_390 [Verrucomicrobiota bacterium]
MNSRALAVALALCSVPAPFLFADPPSLQSEPLVDPLSSIVKPLKPSTPSEMATRFFHEALRPYGQWIEIEGYGTCWKPLGVDALWSPYTIGEWAFSQYGWTWVSDEDFGSIVYHYGRWLHEKKEGWCWVPDLEWAASWVTWRYGTEYLGWAPLPPEASWQPQIGIAAWADREYGIGPAHYRFCLISNIGNASIQNALLDVQNNPDCVKRTVNTTNYASFQNSVFAGGPDHEWIASRSRESVEVLQVLKERSLLKYREQLSAASDSAAKFRGLRKGSQITLMAPEWGILADPRRADSLGFYSEEPDPTEKGPDWTEGTPATPAPKLKKDPKKSATQHVAKPVLLRGWEGLPERARIALQTKVAREVAGLSPANFPARAVEPARDLPASATSSVR